LRHDLGYGSDAARETMNDEVDHAERRWTMVGRLLESLRASGGTASRDRD
jgi:hypothetical protein